MVHLHYISPEVAFTVLPRDSFVQIPKP